MASIPIRELSEKTGLAKTTLTGMLDRLEAQELAVRTYSAEDRRTVRIRLTQKARKLRKKYDKVSEQMNRIFYRGFTDEEIFSFESALGKVLENLNNYL